MPAKAAQRGWHTDAAPAPPLCPACSHPRPGPPRQQAQRGPGDLRALLAAGAVGVCASSRGAVCLGLISQRARRQGTVHRWAPQAAAWPARGAADAACLVNNTTWRSSAGARVVSLGPCQSQCRSVALLSECPAPRPGPHPPTPKTPTPPPLGPAAGEAGFLSWSEIRRMIAGGRMKARRPAPPRWATVPAAGAAAAAPCRRPLLLRPADARAACPTPPAPAGRDRQDRQGSVPGDPHPHVGVV